MVIAIMSTASPEGTICRTWRKKRPADDTLTTRRMSSARHDDILQGFVQENMENLGNRNLKDWGPNKLKSINV